MIANEQSTEAGPASNDVTTDLAEKALARPTRGQAATDGMTAAEYEWGCILRGLWERFEGPAVQRYLVSVPLFGGNLEAWRAAIAPSAVGAGETERRALLRRCIDDLGGYAGNAAAALVVLQLLLWSDLDAVFARLVVKAPHHEPLGADLLGCLSVAVKQLPHRLEHAAERGDANPDLAKELVSLTSYLCEQLVSAHEHDQQGTHARVAQHPAVGFGDEQTEEHLGAGEIIAGLFSATEVARILDEEHLFRFRVAASTYRGRALLRVVRYPILRAG